MIHRPLVIKIGGSLYPHAKELMKTIKEINPDAILIPGGGMFADIVRNCHVEGTVGHWMAIAAMEQFGWFLSKYEITVTDTPVFQRKPCILLPYQHMRRHDPLAHSWEVTSDTIAAYFAAYLKAPLLILKSINKIRDNSREIEYLCDDIKTSDIDPGFAEYIRFHQISGWIINGTDQDLVHTFFSGKFVRGTRFGTTLYEDTE